MKYRLDFVLGDEAGEQALVEDVPLNVRVSIGELVGERRQVERQKRPGGVLRETLDQGGPDFAGGSGDEGDLLAHGADGISANGRQLAVRAGCFPRSGRFLLPNLVFHGKEVIV